MTAKKEVCEDTLILNTNYTKKDWDKIFKNITIYIDTREKNNTHITNVLDEHGIYYESKKLNYGDYSFYINEIPKLEIPNIDFTTKFCIERKSGIDELSVNFSHKRKQFENEFERAQQDRAKMLLLIENNTYEDILRHNYISNFEVSSFTASLMTFQTRYRMNFIFIPSITSANFIFNSFKYYLREYLTN